MKKLILCALVIIGSAVIILSFFAPWAKIVTSAAGVTKELQNTSQKNLGDSKLGREISGNIAKVSAFLSGVGDIKIKTVVSGYDIPALANSQGSKLALSLTEVLFKSAENLDVKSYLVYLLPILGIVCGGLAVLGLKHTIFIFVMSLISGAVSIAGLYNLKTMDVSSLAVKIGIENGLWHTMYAFLLIFVIGIAWILFARKA